MLLGDSRDACRQSTVDPCAQSDGGAVRAHLDEVSAGTDPLNADTDADGLGDEEEAATYRTDPLKADTDGDGVSDGDEVRNGTDPLVPDGGTSDAPAARMAPLG